MSDRIIKVPFIFVPHGDSLAPGELARFSDPVRLPARFVRRSAGAAGEGQSEPIDGEAAGNASGAEDAVIASAEPDAAEPGSAPSGNNKAPADPIADFMRVERFLARAGLPSAFERRDDGRPEDRSVVLAQATTPGGAEEAHPGKPLAATAIPAGYVADDPRQWIGHPSVGTGECVPLVQQATGAPLSSLWRPGPAVQGNKAIRPGTAIATFDSNGHYTGHAAIYLGQDERGVEVVDQWNVRRNGVISDQHRPSRRTIQFHAPKKPFVDRGESYYVVE